MRNTAKRENGDGSDEDHDDHDHGHPGPKDSISRSLAEMSVAEFDRRVEAAREERDGWVEG